MLGRIREAVSGIVDISDPRRVGLISVAHGLNEFYAVVLPPILPLLVVDFAIDYAQAGLLLTMFFAMYAVFQLPAGLLADRVGKRRLMLVGLAGIAFGVGLAGLAQSYATLVLAQVVAGISGSTYHPTGMSLISDVETTTTEGRAMGIHGFGGTVGVALAPAIIGGITVVVDWRAALLASGAIGLIATLSLARLLDDRRERDGRNDRQQRDEPNDQRQRDESPAVTDGEASRPLGSESLLRTCYRAIGVALSVRLTTGFLLLAAVHFVVSLQIRSIQAFTTAYVFSETGESTTVANAAFFTMLVGGGVASLGAGDLADRTDRGLLGAGISLATALVLGTTALVSAESTVTVALFAWFFLIGLGAYAVVPVRNAMASAYADRDFSGSLFGLMQTVSAAGGATGPALFGAMAERYGMAVTYPAIGLVCLTSAAAFVALRVVD